MLIIVILSHLSILGGWDLVVKGAFQLNETFNFLLSDTNLAGYLVTLFSTHSNSNVTRFTCLSIYSSYEPYEIGTFFLLLHFTHSEIKFGRLNHQLKVFHFIQSRAGSQN